MSIGSRAVTVVPGVPKVPKVPGVPEVLLLSAAARTGAEADASDCGSTARYCCRASLGVSNDLRCLGCPRYLVVPGVHALQAP